MTEHTIKKVKFVDKWVEFWFKEPLPEREVTRFDQSCKRYMLWDVVEQAGLNEYVDNKGFAGLVVVWNDDRPVSIRRAKRK